MCTSKTKSTKNLLKIKHSLYAKRGDKMERINIQLKPEQVEKKGETR
jgi:hypothetical protein